MWLSGFWPKSAAQLGDGDMSLVWQVNRSGFMPRGIQISGGFLQSVSGGHGVI